MGYSIDVLVCGFTIINRKWEPPEYLRADFETLAKIFKLEFIDLPDGKYDDTIPKITIWDCMTSKQKETFNGGGEDIGAIDIYPIINGEHKIYKTVLANPQYDCENVNSPKKIKHDELIKKLPFEDKDNEMMNMSLYYLFDYMCKNECSYMLID